MDVTTGIQFFYSSIDNVENRLVIRYSMLRVVNGVLINTWTRHYPSIRGTRTLLSDARGEVQETKDEEERLENYFLDDIT